MSGETSQIKIDVALASPLSPEGRALVAELDAHLTSIYACEHTHLLDPETLAQGGTLFGIARLNDAPVGCGAVRFFPEYAEVKRMYVSPHARGLGIARRVLSWLELQAQRNGYTTVRLETGTRNPEAVRLYESSGYGRIEPFGEYTDNGISLCYEKRLR